VKRISLVGIVLLLAAPQLFAAQGWHRSVAEAQSVAKKNNQLILVDLFADWCGWCHKFEAEVVPHAAFRKATANMVLLRVDVEDGKEGTRFGRDFGIRSLPTFLILTPDLELAGEMRGYLPAEPFAARVGQLVSEHETFRRLVANEKSLGKDYAKRVELAELLLNRRSFAAAEKRLKALLAEPALPVDVRDRAYFALATTQAKMKKFDESSATVKKFLTLQSSGEPLERSFLLLGDIQLQRGNMKGALDEFVRFKVRFPDSPLIQQVNQIVTRLEQTLMRQSGS
jgi:thioredoxin-like negative regulator of GroEL